MRRHAPAAALTAVVLALTACSGDAEPDAPETTGAAASPSATVATPESRERERPAQPADDPALDVALSEPVEDSVYPDVGDPGVDALHYQLDLAWTPDSQTLDAVEILTFRATADARRFQLDFGRSLTVSKLSVDGKEADFREVGKNLVVSTRVEADQRYVVKIRYRGTPKPVAAPTTRSDFSTIGWQITESNETWTMQEPFGAYSWYAVNDHPSDKALYDFTISTPSPWVGVANGELESRKRVDGATVTEWHLDEPAASYLVTVAIGDFAMTRDRSDSGVPITYWTPRGDQSAAQRVRAAGDELDWIEKRLGPYPFSTLGIVVVDSLSGMETQTMITLGNGDYPLSEPVIVHELVHQWYGNQVTPSDWRDVWMNEGMTMYFQAMWESENAGYPLRIRISEWLRIDQEARDQAGPPAAYDPTTFGEGNIYFLPGLMWHQLREDIGDKRFFRLAKAWPRARDNDNSSYRDITAWWSEKTGRNLKPHFDAWLLSETTPGF